ncbi:hypothetical protein AVEN_36822-1 [Araneus ventricosus]|uniref:Uncharacterized protein n=1 Tax=Araneus ventricosus TaxID=182803 RepID=A0A4Y2Q6R2_ARAVE|nr:hypothetical protein AVEN_36822-1 [Araneus ventricosus]
MCFSEVRKFCRYTVNITVIGSYESLEELKIRQLRKQKISVWITVFNSHAIARVDIEDAVDSNRYVKNLERVQVNPLSNDLSITVYARYSVVTSNYSGLLFAWYNW